ncbi:MAG: 5-formyltetrahydrofolate cyclo-ligase [Pseudomonadota bacterium]
MASAESVVLANQKSSLRRAMREKRSGLGAGERARASAAAVAQLAALPELRDAVDGRGCIAAFVATQGEIDPAGGLDRARARGARVAFPRVSAASPRLRFHVAAPDDLRAGAFGIAEPPADSPELPPGEMDVMIVPGVAFDRSGRRLGFGGGFYDELLGTPGARPPFVVGLGYDFQLVDACPAGERDARVDCLVTDARVIRCVAAGGTGGGGTGGGGTGGGEVKA